MAYGDCMNHYGVPRGASNYPARCDNTYFYDGGPGVSSQGELLCADCEQDTTECQVCGTVYYQGEIVNEYHQDPFLENGCPECQAGETWVLPRTGYERLIWEKN